MHTCSYTTFIQRHIATPTHSQTLTQVHTQPHTLIDTYTLHVDSFILSAAHDKV